jgi:iodothyronine deiodinase-like protein
MYEKYRNRASFYIVYIQEAHPVDLWQTASNERDNVLLRSPRTEADRFENASQCVRKLGVRIPALIDGMDDKTEHVYTGWPERLYVIAPGGRIVYKSEAGPYGFSPKVMEVQLRRVLQPDMTAAKAPTTQAT